jgi:hypothetical protein
VCGKTLVSPRDAGLNGLLLLYTAFAISVAFSAAQNPIPDNQLDGIKLALPERLFNIVFACLIALATLIGSFVGPVLGQFKL